jgi:hypothetical protein
MRTPLLLLVILATLTACGEKAVKANVPEPVLLTPAPAVVSVPQTNYVEIPARLTKRCSWVVDGKLEEMPDVSRGRKKCLEFYEANLGEIEQVQGTPVPAEDQR